MFMVQDKIRRLDKLVHFRFSLPLIFNQISSTDFKLGSFSGFGI